MAQLDTLIEKHGALRPQRGHPDNSKMLPRVCIEVAYEFAAEAGSRGFGYEVVTAEDIYQRLLLYLIDKGIGADRLEDPDDQGLIRTLARHAAYREVESARANIRTARGERLYELVSFSNADHDGPLTSDEALSRDALSAGSTIGNPEAVALKDDLHSRLEALAEDILSKVPGVARKAMALWVDGEDAKAIGAALGTSYGQARNYLTEAKKALQPEEWSSLVAVRSYFHPAAKRPKSNGVEPTAVLELLSLQRTAT